MQATGAANRCGNTSVFVHTRTETQTQTTLNLTRAHAHAHEHALSSLTHEHRHGRSASKDVLTSSDPDPENNISFCTTAAAAPINPQTHANSRVRASHRMVAILRELADDALSTCAIGIVSHRFNRGTSDSLPCPTASAADAAAAAGGPACVAPGKMMPLSTASESFGSRSATPAS